MIAGVDLWRERVNLMFVPTPRDVATVTACQLWRVHALLILRPSRAAALFNGNGGQIVGAPRPSCSASLGSATVGAGPVPAL